MKRFDLAIKIIKETGRYLREKAKEVQKLQEGEYDIKLLQDIESEKKIIEEIKKFYQEDSFLCEETGFGGIKTENLWVIDPLDGSMNFSRGIPHCCISIAFKGKKEKFGIVYDFFRDELFWAINNLGAYLNGEKITVSKRKQVKESILSLGFMIGKREIEYGFEIIKNLIGKVKRIRMMGSASLDFCYLACSRVDLVIHINLKRWDYESGKIIVEESGGKFLEKQKGDISIFIGTNGKIKIEDYI